MLADAAIKLLTSSRALTPAMVEHEQLQLQALRPVLRSLAAAAAAQLRQFMALHAEGVVLTHSSSLRACCLLLRNALCLMGEALEPQRLQPPLPALVAVAEGAAELFQQQQQQVAQALEMAHALEWGEDLAPGIQMLEDAQQQMHNVQQSLEQQLQRMQQDLLQQQGPTAAAAAVAAAAGRPLAQPLSAQAAEAAAADAAMLLQVGIAVAVGLFNGQQCPALLLLYMQQLLPSNHSVACCRCQRWLLSWHRRQWTRRRCSHCRPLARRRRAPPRPHWQSGGSSRTLACGGRQKSQT
jgi:hypothetical protein